MYRCVVFFSLQIDQKARSAVGELDAMTENGDAQVYQWQRVNLS
jgi:hypothetical protein